MSELKVRDLLSSDVALVKEKLGKDSYTWGEHTDMLKEALAKAEISAEDFSTYANWDIENAADWTITLNLSPIKENPLADYLWEQFNKNLPDDGTDIYLPIGIFKGASMKEVNLPDKCVCMNDGAFEGCQNLETYTAQNTFFNNISAIPAYAFAGCTNLKNVDINVYDGVGYASSVGTKAFAWCKNLASENWLWSAANIGDYAFFECKSLSEVGFVISYTNPEDGTVEVMSTFIQRIGKRAFYGTAIKTLTIETVAVIDEEAFAGISSLTDVSISDAHWICRYAFISDTALTKVDFGNVKELYDHAFAECNALTTVIIRNSSNICKMVQSKYSDTANPFPSNSNLSIYVPKAMLEKYKADENWAKYCADNLKAIEDYPEITGTAE